MMEKTGNLRWLYLSIVIMIIDQWTKYYAVHHLNLFDHYHVMSFFDLSLTYNTGAAWSFLSLASGWQRWFLSMFAIVISIFILIWLQRTPKNCYFRLASLALIFGGACGNLLDRIRLGYVIDFIDLYIKNWHWPIFNIADIAISLGMIMLMITVFQKRQEVKS